MTDLLYGSKPMKAEPINTSMESVVRALSRGVPVVVELEPGDGTYYALMIVPCDCNTNVEESLGHFGILPREARQYFFVAKLESDGCDFIPRHMNLGTWHFNELTMNQWSRELFAWWFGELQEALDGQV